MLEWLGAGMLLLLACPGLYLLSRHYARTALVLRATGLQSIAELRALHQRVLAEVGAGAFAQRVAIEGVLGCDAPLRAELSEVACAAFRYRVDRHWEETVRQRDPAGGVGERTVRGSERVAMLERRTAFWVSDDEGPLLVQPEGARLELEIVVDRFEPEQPDGRERRPLLDRWRNLPARGGRRTLGYHLREEVLQVGTRVYVIGTAVDRGGELCVTGGEGWQEPFLVSVRGREQVVEEAQRLRTLTLYGACTCLPAGLACLVVAFLLWRHGIGPVW